MQETQKQTIVIKALVTTPPSEDRWGNPIHTVDKVLMNDAGWRGTADSRAFVEELLKNGLVTWTTNVVDKGDNPGGKHLSWWIRPTQTKSSS
jgi:hypothetical protein